MLCLKRSDNTIWNKNFILLLLTNIFVFTSFHMLTTTIANYTTSQLGSGEALAGTIAGVFSVSSLLIRPVSGPMVDRLNKKLIYILALGLIFISIFGYSLASSVTVLIIFRLTHGVGWAFTSTVGMTMASDTAPEGKISQTIGTYGLSNVVAMSVAPNLGMYLSSSIGYQYMFYVSAGFVICAIICLMFVSNGQKVERTIPAVKKPVFSFSNLFSVKAVFPMIVIFFNGMAYSSITTFLKIDSELKGILNPGIFFTVYAVMLILVRPFGGILADKKGEKYIIYPGSFLIIASLVMLAVMRSELMLIISGILFGAGYGAMLPTLMSLGFKRVTSDQRGIVSSTVSIGMDVGTGLGSIIAGILATQFGYDVMYLSFVVAIILGFVAFAADQKYFGETYKTASVPIESESAPYNTEKL